MKKKPVFILVGMVSLVLSFSRCAENRATPTVSTKDTAAAGGSASGGFESQLKWGEHLVMVAGCNDCHTPKKMTPTGPQPDFSLALSGHPAKMPPPDVDRKAMESKGLAVTSGLTAWVGPWGISYASNITSDSTGIGNWTEAQFFLALREGKWKGIAGNRTLLPPMPWEDFKMMTDNEIRAVFAYLKSTRPVVNTAPPAAPPVLSMR